MESSGSGRGVAALLLSVVVLSTFTRRHQAADAAVETPVKALRKALGLPPAETS